MSTLLTTLIAAAAAEAAQRYRELMDELLWLRARGTLTDDEEERYAVAMNDRWRLMTSDARAAIEELLAERRALAAPATLDVVDIVAPDRAEEVVRKNQAA